MPGFTITRGLGPRSSPSFLIARGFGTPVIQAIGGATRFVKKQVSDLTERFLISAMLISNNGKEYVKPIISSVQRVFSTNDEIKIFAKTKSSSVKKSEDYNVTAKIVRVRNGNE